MDAFVLETREEVMPPRLQFVLEIVELAGVSQRELTQSQKSLGRDISITVYSYARPITRHLDRTQHRYEIESTQNSSLYRQSSGLRDPKRSSGRYIIIQAPAAAGSLGNPDRNTSDSDPLEGQRI